MSKIPQALALAMQHFRAGNLQAAAAIYQQVLYLDPLQPDALHFLGAIALQQGRLEVAVDYMKQSVAVLPMHAGMHYNLASAYQALGQLDLAVASYQAALRLQPDLAEAHNNMGNALADQEKLDDAIASYRRALALNPHYAEAHYNLGSALASKNQPEEAVDCFRAALRLNPAMAQAHAALSQTLLTHEGTAHEALACLEQAMRLQPTPRLRLASATCLPIIYQSMADLEAWRRRLTEQVRQVRQQHVQVDLTDEPVQNMFYLAYHGLNDRDLQREIAQLYRCPRAETTPSASTERRPRIHVGFLSSFFRDHTIGLLMAGLVKHLSRQDFKVTVLSIGHHDDEVAGSFKAHADRYLEVPRHLPAARRLIAEQQLDVLFYTDVGMDSATTTLAFSRLAPVQCTTWGHPVTTGIDTLDYFISSKALETEQAKGHYTETLIQLASLPIYYYKPELPTPPKTRADFGLGSDSHIYACPQSLFKIHPQFDEILAGILRGDPRATLVMGWPMSPSWEKLLRQRLAATMPDVADRIRFLPKLSRGDFLNLLAVVDVLLDPLHFGGGNTSYEALAFGVPIVTFPSQFLRGRITYGLYEQMQILDCVTHSGQEYIQCALRLGTDAVYRESVSAKILAANSILYENSTGIRELELFFQQVASR